MTISELKTAILEIVNKYFAGATVVWQNTEKVKPTGPLVTLNLGSIKYTQHTIEQVQENSGEIYQVLPSSVPLTVQLFTHGRKVEAGGGYYQEDTALEDIMDFVKYMTSSYVVQLCEKYDIAIVTEGVAQSATGVLDPNYEYRAFQEFTVSFLQEIRGAAGISRTNWKQTPSGGGTKELVEQENLDVEPGSIEIKNNF